MSEETEKKIIDAGLRIVEVLEEYNISYANAVTTLAHVLAVVIETAPEDARRHIRDTVIEYFRRR